MPEIKKQFTGGKMNKDVDERLVPTGEYRDAMNIQVSTSEGSDVGTIQNVLGNIPGCSAYSNNAIGDDAFTVGSISDEKNDTLYWLISGNSYNPESVFDNNSNWNSGVTMKDYIWQYSPADLENPCKPVFVDKYGFSYANNLPNTFNSNILSGFPIEAYEEMQVGWTVIGVTDDGTVSNTATITNVGQPQNYYVEYGFTTQTTPSVTTTYIGPSGMAAGSGILIPMNDFSFQPPGGGLPPNWTQSTGNIVYITDFSGNVSGLVGDQITILPYDTTNIQTFTINAASTVGIVFTGGYGSNVVKLTLSANLALFSPALPNLPGALLQDGTGVQGSYNGSVINALITSSGMSTNDIATGELMVWYYDVNNLSVGDQIYFMGGQQQAPGYYCVASINSTNNSIVLADCTTGTVISGWQVGGSIYGTPQPVGGNIIVPDDSNVTLDQNLDLTTNTYTAIYLTGPRVLNFNHNELITGINIIDDMLFWTDGRTEPKRINIPRSILGTHYSANFHTRLINTAQGISYGDNIMVKEEHIAVIRKAPKKGLSMTLITDRDSNLSYSGIFTISDSNNLASSSLWEQHDPLNLNASWPYDLSTFTPDEGSNIIKVRIKSDIDGNTNFSLDGWSVGSKVVIKEVETNGNIPQIPINDYTIKGVVTDWLWTNSNGVTADVNSFNSNVPWGVKLAIKINSISRTPKIATAGTLDFVIDLFDESEKLYEFKLPRFSYRYKYEDGEYSYFAPWTNVAFKPGSFDYHPKKGYNLGMTNITKTVQLRDFITSDMPLDVVEIDILYKEEASPNIYIVDTFKPGDHPTIPNNGSFSNNWNLNEYTINKDNITGALPSNQFLRPYDNVPRKALAQDIIGNRIVYGNYTQNYNLDINNIGYKPHILHELVHDASTPKSIKSLREYQLGVVFTDKYGRETPILTNNTGTFKIEKNRGINKNKLQLSLNNSTNPLEMEFFKFYIKQSSGEYYNMAMDRWYDAEDGNVWVSFNSADRNKINDDTILVLKKGVDSDELVKDPARFKVIAIENEAPDFIKVTKTVISDRAHAEGSTATNIFLTGADLPEFDSNSFSLAYYDGTSGGTHIYSNTVIKDIHDKTQNLNEEFYFQIKNSTGSISTQPIKIAKINITDEDWLTSGSLTKLDIVLDTPFTSLINSFTDDSTGQNVSKILDTNRAVFWSYKKENKAEFDGRFFVKLFQEDVFKEYIIDNTTAEITEYKTLWDQKVYSFDYGAHNLVWNGASGALPSNLTTSNVTNPVWQDYISATDDIAQDGSSGYSTQNWKICEAFFRGINVHRVKSSIGGSPGYEAHGITGRQGFDSMDLHGDYSSYTFEDVWFLDGAVSEGQYTGHWNGSPSNTNHNGIGISGSMMEFGFGGIQPELDSNNYWTWSYNAAGGTSDSDFYELHNNALYDNDSEGSGLAGRLISGIFFRWAEDPTKTVYKITNTSQFNLVRHESDDLGGEQRVVALGLSQTTYPMYSNIQYHTSTFFRPGNHSKNYVVTVSQVSDPNNTTMPWDPYTSGEIVGGVNIPLVVTVGMAIGGNQVSVSSLLGIDISGYNYGARTVQVGMVCDELAAVVSKISGTTIYFKNYDSNNASPNYTAVSAGATLHFKQYGMNGISRNSAKNINYWNSGKGFSDINVGVDAVGYTIEILEPEVTETIFPRFPAIFETEPTEETGLDIYYEITDNLPMTITRESINHLIPIGSQVAISAQDPVFGYQDGFTVLGTNIYPASSGSDILIDADLSSTTIAVNDEVILKTIDDVRFSFLIEGVQITQTSPQLTILQLATNLTNQKITLNWFNCYSFGNGVESNRVRDAFNKTYVSNGAKASTTLDGPYKEEHRKSGLIYSGLYNSTSGINNLNQFIQAEKITKDLNPTYGSIQKLYAGWGQGGDLIALCEDRVLKILANKDALYNADGNSNITSTNNVLGTATPFAGNYGISKNPESFASESFRAYFTDKVRGAVIRLSMDGLTAISDHGMKDWFRDNLKLNNKLVGSYDDKKDEYNITLQQTTEQTPKTVSFREDVRGWVSFKSFVPENAISCSNEYYTFLDGKLWKHHEENVNRNTFYNIPADTSFTAILNDVPGSVKSFNTINYEGSQSRVVQNLLDNEYYNLTLDSSGSGFSKDGWYVDSIFTDMESGVVDEFIEKEGKWFNYIKGENILHTLNNNIIINPDGNSTFDQASFAIQGLGITTSVITGVLIYGCTDDTAFNYNAGANTDDGSCIPYTYGCTDPTADNYNPTVNTSDNSCAWLGCTQSSCNATNSTTFPANAYNIVDDGSCITAVYGCTIWGSLNYNATANVNQVSCTDTTNPCVAVLNGCTISNADNYNPLANIDNGTCTWAGCTNSLATNYDPLAPVNSTVAQSYNPSSSIYGIQDEDSIYCTGGGCMDQTAANYDSTATYSVANSCLYCDWSSNGGYNGIPITTSVLNTTGGFGNGQIAIATNSLAPYQPFTYYVYSGNTANNANLIATITSVNNQTLNGASAAGSHLVSNLPAGDYVVKISGNPANAANACEYTSPVTTIGSSVVNIVGCMDLSACNYNAAANVDQGCEWTSCAGCMDASANGNPAGIGAWGLQVNSLTPCYIGGTFTPGVCTIACGDGNSSTSFGNYCCRYTVYGCTDNTASNFYGAVPAGTYLVDDGSCTYCVDGCTNLSATNYDPLATCDDGSCTFIAVVLGCMDPLACNYNAAATTGTQTVYCVYPIPNATITIGGTDPNYGQTGPAYFNTGSPVSNLSKTVKHMVINDWPLGTLQQHDMGLSFVWDGPAGQMGSHFGFYDEIHIQLFQQTNPNLYSPTSPFALWSLIHSKAYNNPNFSPFGDELGVRNYGGTTTNLPYPWGTAQNSSSNYDFPVYFNSTVKHNYKVEILQKHNIGSAQWFGGYYNTSTVNCGGKYIFEIQDLPCNAADPSLTVMGCTDVSACNYNMYATCDDGECVFPTQSYYDCLNNCAQCDIVASGCNQALPNCSEQGLGPLYPNTFTSQSQCFANCGGTL